MLAQDKEGQIDESICPNCGDEDTGHDSDWIYDNGYTTRICDGDKGCGTKYKIYWETRATKVEICEVKPK